jgi:hypothetical protein
MAITVDRGGFVLEAFVGGARVAVVGSIGFARPGFWRWRAGRELGAGFHLGIAGLGVGVGR